MDAFWQDLRYAFRTLMKSPGFTGVTVLSLALGIGANTAAFSVVNGLFLRPLPVERPEEMVSLFTSDYSGPRYGTSSYPDFLDFRSRGDVFSGLVACRHAVLSLNTGGRPERVLGEIVTGNYFDVLGVRPSAGRAFLPEEDRTPGTHPVVVLSHALWRRRFAGDPSVVGRAVVVNSRSFTVIGIAPASFPGLVRGVGTDLWLPMMMQTWAVPGTNALTHRGSRSLLVMGRLKPSVSFEQAQARFDLVARQLHETYADFWTDREGKGRRITLVPESRARVFPAVRGALLGVSTLLMAVVALVLLIACANVANLLLARGAARRKEIGIRLSLGATRTRIVRQLITETLVLSIVGAGGAALIILWSSGGLLALRLPLPVSIALDLRPDLRVLAFTALLAVVTGIAFGLPPALAAARPDVVPALKDEAAAGGPGRSRLRSLLVAGQVAVSLVLLVGSGLFLRSLAHASAIDPGFDARGVAVVATDLQTQGYAEPAGREFYRRLAERVAARPGVESVTVATALPLGLIGSRRATRIEGYVPQPNEDMEVHYAVVGPGYFATLRLPIVRGREFTEADGPGAPGVVIVNEAFARRYWPGQDAIGRRLSARGPQGPLLEVVGVARDAKYLTLGEDATPYFYLPFLQHYDGSATLIARSRADAAGMMADLRSEVQDLDPNLPAEAKTLAEHMTIALLPARLGGLVLGGFGALALLLAGVGLYGVMSHLVSLRTREMGIRMALGADRGHVLRLVVSEGLRLALLGLVPGLLAALAAGLLLRSLLYGVGPADPLTFACVILVLGGVSAFASYVPARRATRVDPLISLRYE